jgi:hypothetical protein
MVAQLTAAGIKVEVDPQKYPNGRFALLHDPGESDSGFGTGAT